jgi:hypothetical protein
MARRSDMNVRYLLCVLVAAAGQSVGLAQVRPGAEVERWMTATEQAAGVTPNAADEAKGLALRKAVEEACGVFIKAQTKTKDYQAVYDKVLANTVGYVLEYKVTNTRVDKGNEITFVTVRALVSTKKFEESWASIAHTVNQEGNPRVVVGIAEATTWTSATMPAYDVEEAGVVQSAVEDFFNSKGIMLMDKHTSAKVTKRDLVLASLKDDAAEIAAVGARFKADVIVVGKATARMGNRVKVGDDIFQYQYTGSLVIRAVQTDSGRLLVSKTFQKNFNELQMNAEAKVLGKLGAEFAPDVLKALVEAWARRANVTRTVELNISGMDYDSYKTFKIEAEKLRGVQSVRMREITEAVANIDMEIELTNENLADRLSEFKDPRLKITEITSNRIKLKVVKD